MLRLVGIIFLCLSTLASPAVHAGEMAHTLSQTGPGAPFGNVQDCDGTTTGLTTIAPQHCMTTSHERTEAQRCQVGMTPLLDEAGLVVPSPVQLVVRLGNETHNGITIAPPHWPPKTVSVAQFA